MIPILILGAGKIGTLIACLLHNSKDYAVTLADSRVDHHDLKRIKSQLGKRALIQADLSDGLVLNKLMQSQPFQAVVSCLPYFLNKKVAELAKENKLHYFDLTEDVAVTSAIKKIATDDTPVFIPQCGLAPGFVGIVAHSLTKLFEKIDTVQLRVGALPQHVNNALFYALTWSTEGLINQYLNPCTVIRQGKKVEALALQGLEHVQLDGEQYEAFNTSGGLGSLADILEGQVQNLNYKTMRYPGHHRIVKILVDDLRLRDDRETLKRVLENAIPKTYHDVVLIYVSVTGHKDGVLLEENYVKKIYPQMINDIRWSAIQVTTASGLCCVLDLFFEKPQNYRGFVQQECFSLQAVLDNRFGLYYK